MTFISTTVCVIHLCAATPVYIYADSIYLQVVQACEYEIVFESRVVLTI